MNIYFLLIRIIINYINISECTCVYIKNQYKEIKYV